MSEMVPFTDEQSFMITAALKTRRHLLTGPSGENIEMWRRLVALGWMEELRGPFPSLRAFAITPAGCAALSVRDGSPAGVETEGFDLKDDSATALAGTPELSLEDRE